MSSSRTLRIIYGSKRQRYSSKKEKVRSLVCLKKDCRGAAALAVPEGSVLPEDAPRRKPSGPRARGKQFFVNFWTTNNRATWAHLRYLKTWQ